MNASLVPPVGGISGPDPATVYDPDIDNCAGSPGCGDQRVRFNYFGPMIACPRCYENVFCVPHPGPVIRLPRMAGEEDQ